MWHLDQEDQELGSAAEGCRQLATAFREGVRRARTPITPSSVFFLSCWCSPQAKPY